MKAIDIDWLIDSLSKKKDHDVTIKEFADLTGTTVLNSRMRIFYKKRSGKLPKGFKLAPCVPFQKKTKIDLSAYYAMLESRKNCPLEKVLLDEVAHELNDALKTLPKRQRLALELRFGLTVDRPLTLEETCKILPNFAYGKKPKNGVSRENARRIEEQALRWMRHPSRCRRLKTLLGRHPTGHDF